MVKRAVAALVLVVSLLAPTAFASGRGRDDQPSLADRIIRFVRAHIPPMFVGKPMDDPVVPHP